MPRIEAVPSGAGLPVTSVCRECSGGMTVLKIIPGRGGCEYWTMRCTRCGGIHLDIVEPTSGATPLV
ncbi:MAG: hypothetical protein GY844_13995 [Bradyrhizobium sp.]|nr:hypothetical protein [Bradyrhizobium sp.]